jgi:hypothetical protein
MGGGRGHVAKFARIARALGPGVDCLAAVAALRHAQELRDAGIAVRRCPPLRATPAMAADPSLRGNATWVCYLAASGLARPEVLRESLAFWRRQIVRQDISILVADYAPLALMAAQGLRAEGWDIRIIAVGTGYGVPPAGLEPLPPLHPDFTRVVHPEPEVLATLNSTAAEFGWPPLPRFAALYDTDLALPATFPFLDPYGPWRAPDRLCPPIVDRSADLAAGDEVFVYFSREEAAQPAVLEVLERLPLPRRGFLPGIPAEAAARLAASGMVLEPAPLPATEIAARSAVFLHGAAHGSLCTAALAGLVQVGLPDHKEQLVHGQKAVEAGLLRMLPLRGLSPAALTAALREAAGDGAARRRAREMARALRAGFPADPLADLAARLAPEVAAARRFVTG